MVVCKHCSQNSCYDTKYTHQWPLFLIRLRVLERAKTLRVAVWLHHLDMANTGNGEASYSLEVAWHSRGPLVGFLLALQASSLTFEEVVDRVLVENQHKIESSLDNIWGLWAQLQRELNDLSRAHKGELEKSAHKKMKRDIEQRWERPPRSQLHHLPV